MNLREMGGALRLEMDNCSVSVLELHGKEKLSPNWVVGRKGKVNYWTLTVDDGQLFKIGKIPESVLAISYIIKLQKYFSIAN